MPARQLNAISASPLEEKRNCSLTARPYINTMSDSAIAAIGGATIFHSLIARDQSGRDAHYWAPPAQIPAGAIHAPGFHCGCLAA